MEVGGSFSQMFDQTLQMKVYDEEITSKSKFWILLRFYEKLKLFSKPGIKFYCAKIIICALPTQVISLFGNYQSTLQVIVNLLIAICGYGYTASLPATTRQIYHRFLKEQTGHKFLTPTYFKVIVCCLIINLLILVLLFAFIAFATLEHHVNAVTVFFVSSNGVLNFLSIFVTPMGFLVIGISISCIIDSCDKASRYEQIA